MKFSVHTLLFFKLLQTFNLLLAIPSLEEFLEVPSEKIFIVIIWGKGQRKRSLILAPFQVLTWS